MKFSLKYKWCFIFIIGLALTISGCRTAQTKQPLNKDDSKETVSALKALAGSYKGKPLSDEEAKALAKDLANNEEAKSAVQSITGAVGGERVVVKYCPVDGKRFSGRVVVCPEHHVPLKEVE